MSWSAAAPTSAISSRVKARRSAISVASLRGDGEAEVMPVGPAPFRKRLAVRFGQAEPFRASRRGRAFTAAPLARHVAYLARRSSRR